VPTVLQLPVPPDDEVEVMPPVPDEEELLVVGMPPVPPAPDEVELEVLVALVVVVWCVVVPVVPPPLLELQALTLAPIAQPKRAPAISHSFFM
jgi:hypothetical protein